MTHSESGAKAHGLDDVMATVKERNPGEKEFVQAVNEVGVHIVP